MKSLFSFLLHSIVTGESNYYPFSFKLFLKSTFCLLWSCNFTTMSIFRISSYLFCSLYVDILYLWVYIFHQFWKILVRFLLKYCSASILSILFSRTLTGCILKSFILSFHLFQSILIYMSLFLYRGSWIPSPHLPDISSSSLILSSFTSNLQYKPSVKFSFQHIF